MQTEFDGQLRPSGGGDVVEEEATVTALSSRSSRLRSLQLLPNPATTEVAVSLPGLEPGGRLRILNSLQAQVRSVSGFEGGKVSLKGLTTGMYTVEYQSPTGEKAISRMSVQ